MNTIAGFRKCTLTDDELIRIIDSITDKMYKKPFSVPYRSIPAKPNEDYDLLIGELLIRFDELKSAAKAVIDGYNHPGCVGEMWIPDFVDEPIEKLKQLLKYKIDQE